MNPLESPWPAVVSGLAVALVLAIVFLRTGRGRILGAAGVVLLVTVALVVLERMVVTEPEQIEHTLDEICAAVERNDTERVHSFIAPAAESIHTQADRYLERFTFDHAKVTGDLVIKLDEKASPPNAVATFIARADVRDRKGQSVYSHAIQRVEVAMQKPGDRWLVTGLQLKPLREAAAPVYSPTAPPVVPTP